MSRPHRLIVVLLTMLLTFVAACGPTKPVNTPELGPTNPQIPVDTKVAAWVTITNASEQYVAYVLLVGMQVGSAKDPISLDTQLGTVKLLPGKEQWFSANANVGSVENSEKLTWQVQIVEMLDEAGNVDNAKLAQLKALLEASVGLKDGASLTVPAIIGPAGAVVWEKASPPANASTFSFTDPVNSDVWYLSIGQEKGNLAMVSWGTSKNVAGGEPTTLHEKFASSGAIDLLASTDTSAIKAQFIYDNSNGG